MNGRRTWLVLVLSLVSAPALAQQTQPSSEEARRALADQPFFPNLRGGSLGVPTLTGEGQVGAQGALRSDSSHPVPVLDLFARLGNVSLNTHTSLSLFAESALLQAPRVSYNPTSVDIPNPTLTVQDQSFQTIGFRIDVRVTGVADPDKLGSRCYRAGVQVGALAPGRQVVNPPDTTDCPQAPASSSTADLTNYYFRLRSMRYTGVHLFAGARYLYRGSPAAGNSASGVSGELGLVGYALNGVTAFGSTSVTWLARDRSMDGSNLTLLPTHTEVRATAGIAWRPIFDPARSVTVGLQGSLSWNFWDNEFSRGTQPTSVRGRSFEASVFLSGHAGTSFNGLISFGVLFPYGQPEDSPRFVFTFAPAVAASTGSSATDAPDITVANAGGAGGAAPGGAAPGGAAPGGAAPGGAAPGGAAPGGNGGHQ